MLKYQYINIEFCVEKIVSCLFFVRFLFNYEIFPYFPVFIYLVLRFGVILVFLTGLEQSDFFIQWKCKNPREEM